MSGLRWITILIDSPIEPRWTGMCGALAIRPPLLSKTAQEKSRRSLMLTECAVACRRTPICSATDMNRLLKISSMTGSAPVPVSARSGRGEVRSRIRSPRSVTTACQPGSTTVVARSSAMMAGPSTACPARRAARGNRSTSAQAPAVNMRTFTGSGAPRGVPGPWGPGCPRGAECPPGPTLLSAERTVVSAARFSWAPVTSTDTASTMIVLSGIRKENRRAYSASNAAVISASEPTGTMTAVSVPS